MFLGAHFAQHAGKNTEDAILKCFIIIFFQINRL